MEDPLLLIMWHITSLMICSRLLVQLLRKRSPDSIKLSDLEKAIHEVENQLRKYLEDQTYYLMLSNIANSAYLNLLTLLENLRGLAIYPDGFTVYTRRSEEPFHFKVRVIYEYKDRNDKDSWNCTKALEALAKCRDDPDECMDRLSDVRQCLELMKYLLIEEKRKIYELMYDLGTTLASHIYNEIHSCISKYRAQKLATDELLTILRRSRNYIKSRAIENSLTDLVNKGYDTNTIMKIFKGVSMRVYVPKYRTREKKVHVAVTIKMKFPSDEHSTCSHFPGV